MELPKTEGELQALIDEKIKVAVDELQSKHNGEMASMRKKYADDLEKAKKQATMSAEELANAKANELAQAHEDEFKRLQAFEKTTILKDKLSKAGLPQYFVNDSRLLSAETGEIDKVIKTVKSEYEETQPKGTTHSSVVQTSGAKPQQDSKTKAYEEMGNALAELVK